ncbi:hypothetical protein [Alicycliphilus denitrificans]|uniref:Uncharacterized protein n=1 Tax=Alicycliphilus denitrificans TaxID=179636 RepID=A0A3R7HTC1_9BURK|nr:hypothetical protein [Alicycliphilus denitrificans]RKJ94121.1 hypothetical protein CE154_020675 [Alicycliphilus denitrificans]
MPRPPHPHALPLLRRRLALAWLLLALVLAPTLGRMHQVLHLPGGAAPQAHAHGAERQAFDALHALFAGHGNADCQVLDQQTLVGAALGQAPALLQAQPQLPPVGAPAPAPGTGGAAPFHARAPPLRA